MDDVPPHLRVQAEAYAFRALVAHFQAHPELQNMDAMTSTGFCRNCLSKWLLSGFREMAPLPLAKPLTYDDTSHYVYGMPAKSWKEKYQSKATPDQLARYEASKAHHAQHTAEAMAEVSTLAKDDAPPDKPNADVQLDPCCPDPTEAVPNKLTAHSISPPPAITLSVGVLTVSDRASAGVYEDLSGPMVEQCLKDWARVSPQVTVKVTQREVTPDDHDKITGHLRSWASTADTSCNLIITTGGTGFGPRDVTPEATMSVLQKHLPALSQAILTATSTEEPLSFLSRGTAGVIGDRTVVLNVPGAPRAVSQHLRVGLPMLAHTVASLSGAQGKDST